VFSVAAIDSRSQKLAPREIDTRAARALGAKRVANESLTISTANPLGTRDEIPIPVRMALIPPLENRKVASKIHRI
jgi:hypothetical protein